MGHTVSVTTMPLLLKYKSSHKQYVNKRTLLGSNKTLFTRSGGGPDLTHRPYFAMSDLGVVAFEMTYYVTYSISVREPLKT